MCAASQRVSIARDYKMRAGIPHRRPGSRPCERSQMRYPPCRHRCATAARRRSSSTQRRFRANGEGTRERATTGSPRRHVPDARSALPAPRRVLPRIAVAHPCAGPPAPSLICRHPRARNPHEVVAVPVPASLDPHVLHAAPCARPWRTRRRPDRRRAPRAVFDGARRRLVAWARRRAIVAGEHVARRHRPRRRDDCQRTKHVSSGHSHRSGFLLKRNIGRQTRQRQRQRRTTGENQNRTAEIHVRRASHRRAWYSGSSGLASISGANRRAGAVVLVPAKLGAARRRPALQSIVRAL